MSWRDTWPDGIASPCSLADRLDVHGLSASHLFAPERMLSNEPVEIKKAEIGRFKVALPLLFQARGQ